MNNAKGEIIWNKALKMTKSSLAMQNKGPNWVNVAQRIISENHRIRLGAIT